jgi:hypothetical protein
MNGQAAQTPTTPQDYCARLRTDPRIRVLGTDGSFYRIPEDQVEAAVAAGGRVMGPDEMRVFRQQVFMEHGLFEEKNKKPELRRRKRLVRSSR